MIKKNVMYGSKRRISAAVVISMLLGSWLLLGAAPAPSQMRIQVIPFDSVTLTSQQVLLGETQGKIVSLGGELRLPGLGDEKVPVVFLVHGIGGLFPVHFEWVDTLTRWGFGVFIPDHLSGRGIAPMTPEDYMLSGGARMVDVYRALSRLLKHPRGDPDRMAIMGFSMGGYVTLLSAQERFRRYAPPDFRFAAHIAVYPACKVRLRDDTRVTGRLIRLFHGTADDWTPVEPCRLLVADLRKAGADVMLTEYPGATHAYDNRAIEGRLKIPQAVSTRKCLLAEGEGGRLVHSQTGQPFGPGDPCIEFGVSLQYDEAATKSTREAVQGVLTSAFKDPPTSRPRE